MPSAEEYASAALLRRLTETPVELERRVAASSDAVTTRPSSTGVSLNRWSVAATGLAA